MQRILPSLVAALALAAAQAPAADAPSAPPVARRVEVIDRDFGLTLPDPYRWMEGEQNLQFQEWLRAQGAYTRAQLDAQPALARWRERLQAVSGAAVRNRLQAPAAGRVFFLRLEGGREGVLMVRDADGHERVLLDPSKSGQTKVSVFSPSADGRLVAVNLDSGGSEISHIVILEVQSARQLEAAIDNVWGEFAARWLPDGSGFTYTQMRAGGAADEDRMANMRLRLHRLGTAAAEDPVLVATGSNAGASMAADEMPVALTRPDSSWAALAFGGARPEQRVCVAPLARALTPQAGWHCLAGYQDQVEDFALTGTTLYLLSKKDAPNGRILRLDLARPDASLAGASVVLPESSEDVITALVSARDALYVRRMHSGIDHIVRIPHGATEARELPLPFSGAAYLFTSDPLTEGVLFTLQGWTRPRSAYHYDPRSGALTDLKLGENAPVDYADLVSTETEALGSDGTRVPLSIVRRRDAPNDGSQRTRLEGYGGYGVSLQPYFDPNLLEWVRAGNVYAVAHVRGGGEKGEAWHLAGKGANKHKGVEDLIACARELARLGVSRPGRIAASGASMAGVLIGGALVEAPADFGAFVITAGILNPVRLLAASNGANQISEMGDPRTAAGLRQLAAMDPYQRLRPQSYPPVLLMVGLNDHRVAPWHSGKFAAALGTLSRSPIWLRTDGGTGHFATSLGDTANEDADIYAFLETQLK